MQQSYLHAGAVMLQLAACQPIARTLLVQPAATLRRVPELHAIVCLAREPGHDGRCRGPAMLLLSRPGRCLVDAENRCRLGSTPRCDNKDSASLDDSCRPTAETRASRPTSGCGEQDRMAMVIELS